MRDCEGPLEDLSIREGNQHTFLLKKMLGLASKLSSFWDR